MSHNVKNYYDVVMKLVEESGNLIKQRIWSAKNVEVKSSSMDLVTETDKQVEEILINGLKKEFKDHKFIGEESTFEGSTCILTDDPTWIIDPVDGTLNFVHGNPIVSVSVGLYINKEAEIGIIYVPVFEQLFTAMKGQGAFLNGKPIKVSGVTKLENALVALEGGTSQDPEKMESVKENFLKLYPQVQGYRTYGSAAFNLAHVALGALDAYLEYGPHIWDFAAGNLIIKEAGGAVIDPAGGPVDLMSCRILAASTPELAKQLASTVKQFYPKRDDC